MIMKYNKEKREIHFDRELNRLYIETNEKFIGRVQNKFRINGFYYAPDENERAIA